MQYRQTETEFDFKTVSYGPDQFIIDDFKYVESWEIFSADPQSNQVVLRCGFKIDWLSKPIGIWSLADSMIKSRVRESEKSLKTWFPARANDFLNSQSKPQEFLISQTTSELQTPPEIIQESQPILPVIPTQAIDSNIYFDNVIAGMSFALIALIFAAMIALFVISKKFFGPKKPAQAKVPPSDLLNRFMLPPNDPSDNWNSTI